MHYISHYLSPIGGMTLASDGQNLIGLWFNQQKYFADILEKDYQEREISIFKETKHWLDVYFSGKEPDFIPPLKMICSDFRKSVWEIMLSIPYGKTMTYNEIAQKIAGQRGMKQMSAQAVGGAVGHNSISLIIPCHRVIGSKGDLTGYAGGLDKKIWLLEHEKIKINGRDYIG